MTPSSTMGCEMSAKTLLQRDRQEILSKAVERGQKVSHFLISLNIVSLQTISNEFLACAWSTHRHLCHELEKKTRGGDARGAPGLIEVGFRLALTLDVDALRRGMGAG